MKNLNFQRRKLDLCSKLFVFFWNLLIVVLSNILRLLSYFLPKLKKVLKNPISEDVLDRITRLRSEKKHSFLFFCSSAGEYEQALPIIDRLKEDQNNFVQIIFFSQSGYQFALKRSESTPFILSPFDLKREWEKIFCAIAPDITIIVRHEIWPIFLMTAWHVGKTYLMNVSFSHNVKSSYFNLRFKKYIYRFFDFVDIVQNDDYKFYNHHFTFLHQKVSNFGDTKFDRVKERAFKNSDKVSLYRKNLANHLGHFKRLIVGSAWPKDIEIVLSGYSLFLQSNNNWQVFIALHELKEEHYEDIKRQCHELNLTFTFFSDLESVSLQNSVNIVIVDKMGILGELYACCEAAYVGGANHHKVHNVLEPAAYGLQVAFGPRYFTSTEAVAMISENYATICSDSQQVFAWLKSVELKCNTAGDTRKFIDKYTGVADKIVKNLYDIL